MKLVTFADRQAGRLGALLPGGSVLDLHRAADRIGQSCPSTMQEFIDAGEPAWDLARGLIEAPPEEAIQEQAQLLAPLPRPVRLRDCSLFLEHMEAGLAKIAEMARARGERPAIDGLPPIFKKQVIYYNADHLHIYGPDATIPWPAHSKWMDFELEWACVVGATAQNIKPSDARKHIFGVTLFNDWSARDVQFPFMSANLGPGEGKDFANSLGPCIATLDEFDDIYNCRMTAYVNGELWSSGTTSSMHHRFEDAIVQFSQGKTLYAGEVLGSGTVLNGCGFELDRRLSDGDLVELTLDGVGTLRNRIQRLS